MSEFTLHINVQEQKVSGGPEAPLLWVIRDTLNLTGTIKVENGRIPQNFGDYRLGRMPETPEVDAIHAATRKRIRSLPLPLS